MELNKFDFIELDTQPILPTDLSARAYHGLCRADIKTWETLTKTSRENLLRIRNFGPYCLSEVQSALMDRGYPCIK